MAIIAASVVVLGVLVILDLLLSLGLTRRLRLMSDAAPTSSPVLEAVGRIVENFTAKTMDGESIDEQSLAERSTVVAFVSTECGACAGLKAEILGGKRRDDLVVFVYSGDTESAADFVDDFRQVARVVWAGIDQSIRHAFHVNGYPAVLRITNGVIAKGGLRLRDVEAI